MIVIDSPVRCRFTEAQYYEKGALGGRAEPKACRRSKEKIQRKTPRSDRRLQTYRADISLRPWSSATGHWQRSKGRHGKDAEYQTCEPERFGWMLGTADIGNQDPNEHNDVRPNHAVQAGPGRCAHRSRLFGHMARCTQLHGSRAENRCDGKGEQEKVQTTSQKMRPKLARPQKRPAGRVGCRPACGYAKAVLFRGLYRQTERHHLLGRNTDHAPKMHPAHDNTPC